MQPVRLKPAHTALPLICSSPPPVKWSAKSRKRISTCESYASFDAAAPQLIIAKARGSDQQRAQERNSTCESYLFQFEWIISPPVALQLIKDKARGRLELDLLSVVNGGPNASSCEMTSLDEWVEVLAMAEKVECHCFDRFAANCSFAKQQIIAIHINRFKNLLFIAVCKAQAGTHCWYKVS